MGNYRRRPLTSISGFPCIPPHMDRNGGEEKEEREERERASKPSSTAAANADLFYQSPCFSRMRKGQSQLQLLASSGLNFSPGVSQVPGTQKAVLG